MDAKLSALFDSAGKIILGKPHQLQLALCALLSDGHVLIEDVPGVGKTTLVKTLATLLGLKSNRIQFTNDLLPADILGTSVFDQQMHRFIFHPGPIFGQMVIADELNRATAKTQSALLQAMEERHVTVDGLTHELPKPFFVVATQNPKEQMGTYPLPESQLDRFLMRIDLGYPDRAAEAELLKGERRDSLLEQLKAVAQPEDLHRWQAQINHVHVSDPLIRYLQDLIDYTRSRPHEMQGLSPRAGLAWLRAARAWSFLQNRNMVLPEDVQAVGVAIMSHRLNLSRGGAVLSGDQLARQVLGAVPVE
ncbi:MAG: AAA family ATPase [Bdellovibrionales bacterium]